MLDTDIYDSVKGFLDYAGIPYRTCNITRTFTFAGAHGEDQIPCRYHLRIAWGTLWVQTVYPCKFPPGRLKRFSSESIDPEKEPSGLILDISRGELQYRLCIFCDDGCDDDRIEEALAFSADVLHSYYIKFHRGDEK